MTYCRFCGMESSKPDRCEWCGRELAQPPPAKPPEIVPTTAGRVEMMEEEGRKSRVAFYITNVVLLVLATAVVAIRKELYPLVIIGGLFVSGLLLGYFRIIPSFDNEWVEMGVPLLLILFLPAIIVFAGYMAYGLIYRSMDLTVVWLLGTYVAMLTALEIVTILAMTSGVPVSFMWKIRGVEFLSLAAVIFGWIASGSFRSDT